MGIEEQITRIVDHVNQEQQTEQEVLDKLSQFLEVFYTKVNDVYGQLVERLELPHQLTYESLRAASDLKVLTLKFLSTEITLKPSNTVAFPDSDFLPGTDRKVIINFGQCGRVLVYQQPDVDFDQKAVGTIYVFKNGDWQGTGSVIGGRRKGTLSQEDEITSMVLAIFRDITVNACFFHRSRENILDRYPIK